jgi:hypothetical protein
MKDIGHILKGWEYEAGTINVRRITGTMAAEIADETDPAVAMRWMVGRWRAATWVRFAAGIFRKRLKEHRKKNGTELGFH